MPGFPEGLNGYEKLAPGINVIAGPNASGKSSTARVIQQLIWRNKTAGIHAEASFSVGSDPWEIRIDSNYVSLQHHGQDDELSGLPSSEGQGRYMLALHELVTENEDALAKQIVKESIGGYDLDEARMNLSYSAQMRNKGVKEFQDFEKADLHFRTVRQEHNSLKHDENRLASLIDEREKAENASQLKDLYEKVVDYLKSKNDFDS